jgi:ElaB/YqjD/DUF883 family membrane-anchored ribosome-binding protein
MEPVMTDVAADYQRCAAKIGKNVGVTARTIREKVTHLQNDPRSFLETDVKDMIRENPGASLLVAAGAGLLIGRALRHL